jgi:hypothetical protein
LAAAQPSDPIAVLEERVRELESSRNLLLAVSGTTLIGTALAAALGWFRLLRRVERVARRHVDRLVQAYPGAVERVVQEHETETRLRREAKVAVVSEDLNLQALLRERDFKNLTTVRPEGATSETLEPYAVVVLDLTKGLTEAGARALIESHARDVFLAYSTAAARVDLPPGRATFANSPITLYARLMELLKFQRAGHDLE